MSKNIHKIDDYRFRIEPDYKSGMLVPGIIYADEKLFAAAQADNTIEQVANGAMLPGIVKASLAMPDIHFGYGLPIGGVVATRTSDGIISPGGTGYDINCGVRLIRSNLQYSEIKKHIRAIIESFYSHIPTGVGSHGAIRLSPKDRNEVLLKGSRWAIENGYGTISDLSHTEANGELSEANPDKVSPKAIDRGKNQLGTLGSGNHFLEVQYVDEIFDPETAQAFGLEKGAVTLMIHTGSRGLGHQVCTDYLEVMQRVIKKYGINIPDRQLACAPFNSPEGQDYLAAMRAAANYAWANRQILMSLAINVLEKILGNSAQNMGIRLVYDVAHNIVKVEEHVVQGEKIEVAVHRKGATRSFPPLHPELPSDYRSTGQPVIIPGDMGRASYVLVGTEKAMEESFGSTCHGAGRVLGRNAAIRAAKGRSISRELEDQGIIVRVAAGESLKEEMPEAYKDVSEVVNVVHQAGLSRKVARLKPLGVIKG